MSTVSDKYGIEQHGNQGIEESCWQQIPCEKSQGNLYTASNNSTHSVFREIFCLMKTRFSRSDIETPLYTSYVS